MLPRRAMCLFAFSRDRNSMRTRISLDCHNVLPRSSHCHIKREDLDSRLDGIAFTALIFDLSGNASVFCNLSNFFSHLSGKPAF